MTQYFAAILWLCVQTAAPATGTGDDPPLQVKHQVTGLFSAGRETALRVAFEQIPGITLVGLDYENAEVTLENRPAKVFSNATPEQVIQDLDNRLKAASDHTFGVKPLRTLPGERLKRVEIPVAGLDCEACSLAAYEAVYRLAGVKCATASLREGRVTAWIDPETTNRLKLEAALNDRGVALVSP